MTERARRLWPWVALVLAVGSQAAAAAHESPVPASAPAPAPAPPSPRRPAAPEASQAPITAEEQAELSALAETVERFESEAAEYRESIRAVIEQKYQQKRAALSSSYEKLVSGLEGESRYRRDQAISVFENFVARYPNDARYTPDALFRLSELYFERSYEEYLRARNIFDKALAAYDAARGDPEPVEPVLHYEATIATMQRLITLFPDYRLIDGAYYLLGFCLGEQGEEDRAVDVYEELLARRPETRFAAEVWTRVGEHYFDANELERATIAYNHVLDYVDSPFYDKALYKLAWTHYRLADPERAPKEYQLAVDTFVRLLDFNEKTRAAGAERGGELRKESLQYLAICYADEQWGSLKKATAYLDKLGKRPYERELLETLGDVYSDQTRFPDAVAAYRLVQQRFPMHPDAPLVQLKIIGALERARDFDGAARERDALVAAYDAIAPWTATNVGDEAALARAEKATADALRSAALFHHKQAQTLKEAKKLELASAEYGRAAETYLTYLGRFPHDKQLYEEPTFSLADCLYYSQQFDLAAARYESVRDSTASTKLLEDAALSVVLSYENAIKAAEEHGKLPVAAVKKSSDRRPSDDLTPKALPELKQRLITASDRYAELFPNGKEVAKVLYKAAEVFYTYDHFDEARRRFNDLLARFPKDEVAEFAANLVIESFLAERNYTAVEGFSRSMLDRPDRPGRKAFSGDLVKFKSGAMFKLAEDAQARGQEEAAAELYLQLLTENPRSEFADSALNNAAVAYEKVKRYDSASRLYERLAREHPRSPLADNALFRVGVNAERFFDFDKAIDAYGRLVAQYPKSERRADALYNVANALENMREYERAAREYQRYCELFRSRDDAAEVCFRAGAVYEKMGMPRRVISTYETFVRAFRGDRKHGDRVVEAFLKIGQAHQAAREPQKATAAFEAAVAQYKRSPDPKSAAFAAAAQFYLVDDDLAKLKALRFQGDSKAQKATLTRKAEQLKKVEDRYKAILAFKQIEWTLASLYRIGNLYQDFADSLIASPCPGDVRKSARAMGATADEVCDEYRVLLEEKAAAIEDKAVSAYETTITRAREFQVANRWTKQTLVALNKLRGKLWPLQKDAKEYVAETALAAPGPRSEDGAAVGAPAPAPAEGGSGGGEP